MTGLDSQDLTVRYMKHILDETINMNCDSPMDNDTFPSSLPTTLQYCGTLLIVTKYVVQAVQKQLIFVMTIKVHQNAV